MGSFMIKGNAIYTSEGVRSGAILIEDNRIKDITTDKNEMDSYGGEIIHAESNPVIPGFIDIHIHGAGGWNITGGGIHEIRNLAKYLASKGVTSFQPTIGGSPLDIIKKSVKNLRTVIEEENEGARMLGIHMEGPFLNPEKKGAFKVEYLLKPSLELMEEFVELSCGRLIHVSLAPELEGAEEVVKYLVNKGILVSGAHTNANIEQTKKAIEWGVTLSNHTCNAQRSIHHREPGALGGYLLDDRVDCELICDSFHVHPDMIKLVIKIKSTGRICVVSDSITASGIKPGEYNFLGHTALIDRNGWSRLSDGTIAGSTKDILFGVKNLVTNLGFSLDEAIRMACRNPARLSGHGEKKGILEAERDADIIVINKEFEVLYTFVEGKLVYKQADGRDYTNPEIKFLRSIEEAEGDYIG